MGTTRRRLLQLSGIALAGGTGRWAAAAPAHADQQEAADLEWADQFDRPDGPVGNDWVALRGDWVITDQTLETTGGPADRVIAQTAFQLGASFSIEATLRLDQVDAWSGIAFNVADNGDGTQDYYAIRLVARADDRPPSWQLLQVSQSVVGDDSLIAQGPIPIEAGVDYTVRLGSSSYGVVDLAVLDGPTELMAGPYVVPLARLLSGGLIGVYSGAGQVHADAVGASTSRPVGHAPDPGPLTWIPFEGVAYELSEGGTVADKSIVDQTWAGHSVGRSLLTHGSAQYAAYYDAERRMVVAQRDVGSDEWTHQSLDTVTAWDSHNYVTMAMDSAGRLHVSGNMHVVPLVYYRMTRPGDVTSLIRVPTMIDSATEQRVTYPTFMHNGAGELIFRHRDGSSGNGVDLYNIYDTGTQTWSRLLDEPLHDGQGLRNAYVNGPTLGPDGWYHLVWVWRDTGDAATNQRLSYARSRDLRSWETSDGSPLTLPVTYASGEVIDPVPMNGGMVNGNTKIGFDTRGLVVVSYHKYDEAGNTQIYVARREPRGWKIRQVSQWQGRWTLGGFGSLIFEVTLGAVAPLPDGYLRLDFTCRDHHRTWILSPSLRPIAEIDTPQLPSEISEVRSTFPGLVVNLAHDLSDSADGRYLLRWESRQQHNDQPWDPPHPEPGPLEIYHLT